MCFVKQPHYDLQHASDAPDQSDDGIGAEDSQSEDNSQEYNSRQQGLCDVKDWVALDFSIMRNAALRKVCLLLHPSSPSLRHRMTRLQDTSRHTQTRHEDTFPARQA